VTAKEGTQKASVRFAPWLHQAGVICCCPVASTSTRSLCMGLPAKWSTNQSAIMFIACHVHDAQVESGRSHVKDGMASWLVTDDGDRSRSASPLWEHHRVAIETWIAESHTACSSDLREQVFCPINH